MSLEQLGLEPEEVKALQELVNRPEWKVYLRVVSHLEGLLLEEMAGDPDDAKTLVGKYKLRGVRQVIGLVDSETLKRLEKKDDGRREKSVGTGRKRRRGTGTIGVRTGTGRVRVREGEGEGRGGAD